MIRATTPIHSFLFRDNPSQYAAILITYAQGHNIVLEKKKQNLHFGQISDSFSANKGLYRAWYRLTQEETRKFRTAGGSKQIIVQIRILTEAGEALASKKKTLLLEDVLNDEILVNPGSSSYTSIPVANDSEIPVYPPANGAPIVDMFEHGTEIMVDFEPVETSTYIENDYNHLINKPTINGKPLEGDMQSEDLHIEPEYPEYPAGAPAGGLLSWSSDGTAEWVLIADEPEEGNLSPISSAAVYATIGNINALLDQI